MSSEYLHVLVVDDEESFRAPLQKFLQTKYNYAVEGVVNGHDALQRIEQAPYPFDVALLDQSLLEDPNGIELARIIKLRCPHIETIILTGWGLEETKQAMEAGVFRYIKKSQFDADELALLIRSAAQHARLHAISHSILSEYQLDRLLALIAATTRSLTASDEVAIVLPNQNEKGIQIYPQTDLTLKQWRRHFRQENLTARIIQTGVPIQVRDTQHEPGIAPEVIASGIRAFVGVPIPGRTGPLGVLYVYSRAPERFDTWGAVTVLQTLAAQAGVAIANAQALMAEQRRTEEFERLHDLSTELTGFLELDEVLQHVASASRQLIRAERVTALVRLGHEPNYHFFQCGASVDPERYPPIIIVPRPHGFTVRHIFEQDQHFLIPDLQADANAHPEIFQMGVRSTLGAPIKFAGQTLGALYAHSNRANTFQAADIKRLQYLAYQVGGAVYNALRHRSIKLDRDLLAAMADQLRYIDGEKQPDKLQLEIVRLAVELLNCDVGGLWRNYPEAGYLELFAPWGFEPSTGPVIMAHGAGVIGATAQHGQAQLMNHYVKGEADDWLQGVDLAALMAVPFLHGTDVEAVLFVGRTHLNAEFEERDLAILRRFAEQSAVAWRTSLLLGLDQRRVAQLEILRQIGDYIQSDKDLDHIFHIALTGITAGFGMAFNRAALFLLDDDGHALVGKMGIGELEFGVAHAAWQTNRMRQLDQFKNYLAELNAGKLLRTSIEQNIRGLQIRCEFPTGDLFCRVMQSGHWEQITQQEDLQRLPAAFVKAFAPALPLAIIALRVRDKTTGLLVVDNKFTKAPITHEDINALKTFATTIAVVIDNVILLQKMKESEQELRALFTASHVLLSKLDAQTVLQNVVELARQATGAASVSAVLIDERKRPKEIVTRGELQGSKSHEIIRPAGLSMEVMTTGEARKFEDAQLERARVNPTVFERKIAAALCLPLTLEDERIGVVWYHYNAPRTFSEQQIATYQLYANQAVLAYDIAQRIRRLQHLLTIADELASTRSFAVALQQVTENARQLLQADWTALWPYDEKEGAFVKESACQSGVNPEIWEQLRQEPQLLGGTGKKILLEGKVSVTDLDDHERYEFVGNNTRRLLKAAGVASFQAFALRAGAQTLGVLFANYKRPRDFGETATVETQMFARHAALTLQKAKLLDHETRAHKGAQLAARIVTLSDNGDNLQQTLDTIVQAIQDVLDCDIVTLYAYEQEKQDLRFPPAAVGVQYRESVLLGDFRSPSSIVHQILAMNTLRVSLDASNDQIFSQGGFVEREKVMVVVGVPLHVGERKVGVMFVNYRQPHRLDDEDQEDIRLFANIAAVAIRNAQLVEDMRRVKGYVGSHTALEWMKMVSVSWSHTIRREVGTAKGHVDILRMLLDSSELGAQMTGDLAKLVKTLDTIATTAIIAPLAQNDGVEAVLLHDHLCAYVKDKQEGGRYRDVLLSHELTPDPNNTVVVRASRAWLRRAYDILLENAVYAMRTANSPEKCFSSHTKLLNQKIEISFKDTGPGIPPAIQAKLFKEQIEKLAGAPGAGVGLLELQAIVQTYGGNVYLRTTNPEGSEFVIELPIQPII